MPVEKCRSYATYEDYLLHQASKAQQPAVRNFLLKKRTARVGWFYVRFAAIAHCIPRDAKTICLGARFGEEVEALHKHGITDAFGIDLAPCPPYVIAGDMNALAYAENSFDFIYTNALDHTWNAHLVATNITRICKPNGWIMLHLPTAEPEEFETHCWSHPNDVADLFSASCTVVGSRPIERFHGLDHEFLLRKNAAE